MSEVLSLEQIEDEIGMLVRGGGDADRLLKQFMALRAENERLRRLLSEVAEGGVEFADERVRYVAVQIDRETWAEVLALAKGDDRGRPA